MRLENCVLNFNVVVSAPLTRTEPEEEWVRATESDAISASLYDLYSRANFLSFGSAPSFSRDDDNLLFSYFSMLLRSLMESLVDADEQLRSFLGAQKLATADASSTKIRQPISANQCFGRLDCTTKPQNSTRSFPDSGPTFGNDISRTNRRALQTRSSCQNSFEIL